MPDESRGSAVLQEIDYDIKPLDSSSWGWVYREFFQLDRPAFSMMPDKDFFYCHTSAQAVLNTLYYAIKSGESMVKLIGEAGVGKTLVCERFLSVLDSSFVILKVYNPNIDAVDFLRALLHELNLPCSGDLDANQLVKYLLSYLADLHRKQCYYVVVFIDDAQRLDADVLETIRVLSNLGCDNKKYLQFILAAQPELDVKLAHHNIDGLGQRITFSATLSALKLDEVQHYLQFRLSQSGCDNLQLFTRAAVKMIFKASHGIPRLVNVLAHKAMLIAYGEGKKTIHKKHIAYAIADTESLVGVDQRRRRLRRVTVLIISIGGLIAVLLSI